MGKGDERGGGKGGLREGGEGRTSKEEEDTVKLKTSGRGYPMSSFSLVQSQ